ncbi:MAG: hypothetical protein ABIK09_05030 [Pseudomonadota bacterium]
MSQVFLKSERLEQSDPLLTPRVFRNYDELKGGEGKQIHFRQYRYQVSEILARAQSLDPRILTEGFEGELVDFSISGVRCRVHGAVPAQTGDQIEVGRLLIGDELFYEGRVRVAHKTVEPPRNGDGERTLVGFNLLDDVIDIPRIFRSRSSAEMREAMSDTAEILTDRDISPAYRQTVADFAFLVSSYRNLMARQETEIEELGLANRADVQEEVLQSAWEHLRGPIEELQERLDSLTRDHYYDRRMQELYRSYTSPLVTPLLIEGPFFHRSWSKPLGYPGDYVIMQQIYNRAWEGGNLFSRLIHRFGIEHVMAEAVRSRKRLLRREIEMIVGRTPVRGDEPVRIISLGSGPAREIIEFVRDYDGDKLVEFVMIDQDNTALGDVNAVLAPLVLKSGGRIRTRFLYIAFSDLIGSRERLVELARGDLVYCAGMFDYLATKKAEAVIIDLFSRVKPGGTLVVGNFGGGPKPPSAWVTTYTIDWFLRYRSREEMQAIGDVLSETRSVEVITEETGIHYFIRAVKKSE